MNFTLFIKFSSFTRHPKEKDGNVAPLVTGTKSNDAISSDIGCYEIFIFKRIVHSSQKGTDRPRIFNTRYRYLRIGTSCIEGSFFIALKGTCKCRHPFEIIALLGVTCEYRKIVVTSPLRLSEGILN